MCQIQGELWETKKKKKKTFKKKKKDKTRNQHLAMKLWNQHLGLFRTNTMKIKYILVQLFFFFFGERYPCSTWMYVFIVLKYNQLDYSIDLVFVLLSYPFFCPFVQMNSIKA